MWAFMTQTVTRLASAVGLLTLLLVVPAGQMRYIGWPLPDHAPSVDELHTALTNRDWLTDATLVDGLSALLWLLWLLFVASVMVELGASIRGVRPPQYRLLTPTQGIASALVAGLTATIVATAPAPALTPSLLSPPAQATTPAAATLPTTDMPGAAPTSRADAASFTPVGSVVVLIGDRRIEHTVAKDETLWRIADIYLGDGRRWTEIWELNKGKYWPHVSGRTTFHDPDLIFPGWVLTLPADAAPPPAQPDNAPSEPTPHPPRAAPSPPPSSPAPAAPTSPPVASPTPARPDPDGVVESHQPPASSPTSRPGNGRSASIEPAVPTQTPADQPTQESDDEYGVAVPNGWVTIGLAAAVAAAAAVVWLRRRHRYDPHTPSDPATDPTLQPLPATVTRLRREVRRQAPHLLDPPDPGPTVREYAQMDPKPTLPEPGPHGPELAGWGPLPTGGLGLTGPGAAGAARAMLVATLSAGHAFDPDAEATVVVPASVLADLVGGHAVVDLVGSIPRLIVTPGLSEAVTHLHRENLDRAWILDQHDAQDLAELRTRFPDHEPLPPMLLIADTPEPAKRGRLSTVLELSHGMGIGAVLLGDWPAGTTVHVAPDGSTTGGDGQRLSTLDQPTTMDSIAVLREAQTGEPPEPAAAENPPTSPAIDGTGTRARPAPTTAPISQGEARTADQPRVDLDDAAAANGAAGTGDQEQTTDPSTAGSPPPPDTSGRSPDVPAGAVIPVQVRVLGRVAILKPDGTAVAGLRRKAAELLLYLAAHRGGAAIDDIKEALWPDAPMSRAKERLATDVANLRASLRAGAGITAQQAEPDAAAAQKPRGRKKPIGPEFVLNPGGRYILAPDLVDVDWWRVGDAVAEASTAADTPARRAALERAVAAFAGLLYDADGTYEWANVEVEVSRRHGVTAHTQLAELVGPGQPEQAAGYLQTAADLDPINEDLAVAAMRAHAAAGDIEAIRARFSRLSRALLDTGQEPAEETSALATKLCREVAARRPRSRPGDLPRADNPPP
jgi:DNA-binding SARP family transcriptional activator